MTEVVGRAAVGKVVAKVVVARASDRKAVVGAAVAKAAVVKRAVGTEVAGMAVVWGEAATAGVRPGSSRRSCNRWR